jgi:hypothetical protein
MDFQRHSADVPRWGIWMPGAGFRRPIVGW